VLGALTTTDPEDSTEDHLNPVLVPVMMAVLQRIAAVMDRQLELEEDTERGQFLTGLVTVLGLLLPEVDDQEGVDKVKELIKTFQNSIDPAELDVMAAMVKVLFQMTRKVKSTGGLGVEVARGLHSLLGDNMPGGEVQEEGHRLPWLTMASRDLVLEVLLDDLARQLELCETTVSWCSSLATTSRTSAQLRKAETQVCLHLVKQMNCCIELVKNNIPVGSSMEALFKVLLAFFTALDNLAKHFFSRAAAVPGVVEAAKFDKAMKHMMDNKFTKRVYTMITYMENAQNDRESQAAAARKAKKKALDPVAVKAKVMRESRNIPNLVLKIELLERDLIKLGKRMGVKEGLIGGGKLTQARDFRIKINDEMERKLVQRDEEEDREEDDLEEDDDNASDDDSRLAATGASALGDVTNTSSLVESSQQVRNLEIEKMDCFRTDSFCVQDVPGSPILKKRKLKRQLQSTAAASQMLMSSASEPSSARN
jgi:hypothetical protein